jgi:predicted amidohydrolase YtcJ
LKTRYFIYITVWLASFMLGNSSVMAQSTSTKFVNVNGYTLNSAGELSTFSEFVIQDDKIVVVGEAAKLFAADVLVDLDGQTVLPGLIDAHGHILKLGANLLEVDIRNTESEQAAVTKVLSYIGSASTKTTSSENWVTGRGWNQVLWPTKAFPTKASLDKVIADRPVYLSRVDGHAAWVNSKALELAGIDRNTPSPSGGEIVKDAYGEPSGLLIDNAENLIRKILPKPSEVQYQKYLDAAMAHLLSLGITSAHDAGISKEVRDFYIKKAQANELNVRIYAMLAARDPNLLSMLKAGHYADQQGFLSIRSVKAYGDGALGSRGAALLAPYSDDPNNSGLLVTAQETLPSVFNNIIGANFQLNFHAIGDRANRLGLQQFAKSFEIFPENKSRHRIEHAQVIALADIPLFKKYGIIPSMQPTHATSDMNMAEDRIGKARLKGAYAWQTFLEQGTPIAFGSDFPVELANVFHGLHAAVTRQNASQQPAGGWIGEESVSRIQALKGFTLDAAYAGYQENIIGSIETGKKADFIVIDKDYFKVPEADIRNIQVLQTFVNGKLVYSTL